METMVLISAAAVRFLLQGARGRCGEDVVLSHTPVAIVGLWSPVGMVAASASLSIHLVGVEE